jgi:hypothetical protein
VKALAPIVGREQILNVECAAILQKVPIDVVRLAQYASVLGNMHLWLFDVARDVRQLAVSRVRAYWRPLQSNELA